MTFAVIIDFMICVLFTAVSVHSTFANEVLVAHSTNAMFPLVLNDGTFIAYTPLLAFHYLAVLADFAIGRSTNGKYNCTMEIDGKIFVIENISM